MKKEILKKEKKENKKQQEQSAKKRSFGENERKVKKQAKVMGPQEQGKAKTGKPSRKPGQKNASQKKYQEGWEKEKLQSGKQGQGQERKTSDLCPAFGRCGGCQYLDLPYEKQLSRKQKQVEKLLKPYCKVERIIGMKDPFHYRNKVHAVFGHRGNEIISGTYQEGTHRIVPVESCRIQDQRADDIIRDIRALLPSFKIKTYNEDTGYGLFRHALVRIGRESGQVMVVLVLSSPIMPSKNNFVKALRKLHPEITTVVLNVNDKNTSMVLGERESVLYGKGYIEDTLCGCTFRLSSKSFYQVNPVQTEKLYSKAIELAGLTGRERVIDAYCGIGTIGLIASREAGEVIGVELNPDAVRDAVYNAKRNGTANIRFYQSDAGAFMTAMAEAGETADAVFMDPPRAGSDEAFLSSVVKLSPKKIVYISCNPETLARDLKYLTEHGYEAGTAWPVDMFPMTDNVETVVLLSHKKPDSVINVKVEFGEGEGKIPLDNIEKRAESYKPKERVTYKMIKEYIEAKYGFKVHTAYLDSHERQIVIHSLVELKNKLIQQGRYTDCVDELIFKVANAPVKRMKIEYV